MVHLGVFFYRKNRLEKVHLSLLYLIKIKSKLFRLKALYQEYPNDELKYFNYQPVKIKIL